MCHQGQESTCSAGTLVYQNAPPISDPDVSSGTSTGVTYQNLALKGWGVLDKRPLRTNTTALNTLFGNNDFWSVVCNGNGFNTQQSTNKINCNGNNPVGAVHMRYDCGANRDSGTIWILT